MRSSYRMEFFAYLVWGVCVFAIFKLIQDRQVAGTVAGVGFLLLPLYFLVMEVTQVDRKSKMHMSALICFLMFSVLPIILIRIFNFGVDFNSLSVFGVPAQLIHRYSNLIYVVMMMSAFYHWIKKPRT